MDKNKQNQEIQMDSNLVNLTVRQLRQHPIVKHFLKTGMSHKGLAEHFGLPIGRIAYTLDAYFRKQKLSMDKAIDDQKNNK